MEHVLRVERHRLGLSPRNFVQNGINHDTVMVVTDDEWRSCDRVLLTIEHDALTETWTTRLEDGPVVVPSGMLAVLGTMRMSLTGYVGEEQRLTTQRMSEYEAGVVVPSGALPGDGEPPQDASPDLWQQLMEQVDEATEAMGGVTAQAAQHATEAEQAAQSAKESAQSAKEAASSALEAEGSATGAAKSAEEAAESALALVGNVPRGTKSGATVKVDDAYPQRPLSVTVEGPADGVTLTFDGVDGSESVGVPCDLGDGDRLEIGSDGAAAIVRADGSREDAGTVMLPVMPAPEARVSAGGPDVTVEYVRDLAIVIDDMTVAQGSYEIGHGLKVEGQVLSVDSVSDVEQDNTLPITSAGVYTTVGNINAILMTI